MRKFFTHTANIALEAPGQCLAVDPTAAEMAKMVLGIREFLKNGVALEKVHANTFVTQQPSSSPWKCPLWMGYFGVGAAHDL